MGSICPCVWTETLQGKPLCYVGQAPCKLLGVKCSCVCVHSSSCQLLNPVTQSFHTFLVNSQKYSPAEGTLRSCAHRRWQKLAKGRVLQHPLSPNQSWWPRSMEGSNHPSQAGGPWERRSLTSAKHSSVKAFLSRGALEHAGRRRDQTCPQYNQPPSSLIQSVQAAEPPSTGCHYTHCPSTPNHRLKCQTKRLRFGNTTLSVQTPTCPTSTST